MIEELDACDAAFFYTYTPPGAIPVQMVAVLAWLDPETGEYTMGVVKALSSRPDQDLGLLEMAKYNLLRRHED